MLQTQGIISSVDYKVDQFQQNWVGPERSWCLKNYHNKQIWNPVLSWVEKGYVSRFFFSFFIFLSLAELADMMSCWFCDSVQLATSTFAVVWNTAKWNEIIRGWNE